ncbi:MAG: thermonuclease family protein [Planctomycetes bacterium]|nr:thermonuclease family protein [Planctomycetota bacterium]
MRRQRRFPVPRRIVLVRSATILILCGLAVWQHFTAHDPRPVPQPGTTLLVTRVIDGDTLLLEDQSRVRLIGANAPEVKHPDAPAQPFADAATQFTRQHVEGVPVRLEFDKERRDKYGRTLAYVYVEDWLLNEELIRAGFATAMTKYPYSESMKRRFRDAQAIAQRERRGLWSTTPPASRTAAPPGRR